MYNSIESTIEHQLVIFLVAPTPTNEVDRRKLITHKWRTNADIKERDVHCRLYAVQVPPCDQSEV
ncbi:hypothetical protein T4A_14449 [Trichinella pseudospiralis]|uniref:Uncharacterized protein n=1 Tax=Trichinella pseudospiralis TaxID=6337 RepID=A0A0V1E373_TRIPS|nr:hypothetical protein T4A_14449 [Trichinella pseudospiralis]